MNILLVTEKCSRITTERDGGARLVETLQRAFGDSVKVMQFGSKAEASATWHFEYPSNKPNRFERRLDHANFIAQQVKAVECSFTHVIFIHISMQFGTVDLPLRKELQVWTFPMFLTPSYRASGEVVPEKYFEMEKQTLSASQHIITPSHLEKRQLVEIYSIPTERIHVVPRGIQTHLLRPKVRTLDSPLKFCSVGSIKPQKNTWGLLHLFKKIEGLFPGATLEIIGPVQNADYFSKIEAELHRLKLVEIVNFSGYISPTQLPFALEKAHLHLSTSPCETFGRSIFETLASGLPNIARKSGNAAAEFLENLPYARFVDEDHEALDALDEILPELPLLSSLALEVGELYDDAFLSRLLASKFCEREKLVVSDFDGTLYHKDDPERTVRCLGEFQKFSKKVICSARPIDDLLDQLKHYNLKVDWIVASSGALIADGDGKLCWLRPLDWEVLLHLESQRPESSRIEFEGDVLQIALPAESVPSILGLRSEIYQGTAFIAHWGASKLRAVHWLLRYIGWQGCVQTFGDGPYDAELLTYFDGTWISSIPIDRFYKKEIEYV